MSTTNAAAGSTQVGEGTKILIARYVISSGARNLYTYRDKIPHPSGDSE